MSYRCNVLPLVLLICGAIAAPATFGQEKGKQRGAGQTDAAAAKSSDKDADPNADKSNAKGEEPKAEAKWRPLVKPGSLGSWEVTNFGGEGEVQVEDQQLTFEAGRPLTGITWKGEEFPKENFEIRLEANRLEGGDFLCGLTFPVGDKHASLIGGGWGGGVVGLSSVDGNDASENSTSSYRDFKNGQWYRFRVRVDADHVTAWVDDEQVFKQEREGRTFSVRAEVLSNRPLGYCVFQSKVAVRNFEWRPLEGSQAAATKTPKSIASPVSPVE
jgi:hypothetical protein